MKELSKDAEIKRTQPTKESAASSENGEPHKTTGEKAKLSALRLFRTVRLACELIERIKYLFVL